MKTDNKKLTLRQAVLADALLLLEWRNDPLTRDASHTSQLIKASDHLKWLAYILEKPSDCLFIAERDGIPVGTVRTNCSDLGTELSWTVAPDARGSGVAKQMIHIAIQSITGRIRAEVKAKNTASLKVALSNGLIIVKEENGIVYFETPTTISERNTNRKA